MRLRWLALPALALLPLVAGACSGNQDDLEGKVDTEAPDLDGAIAIALRSLPVQLPESRVAALIEELCEAGSSGDTSAIVDQLDDIAVENQDQLRQTIQAIVDGAGDYCPDDVASTLGDEVAEDATPRLVAGQVTSTTSAGQTANASSSSQSGGGTSNGGGATNRSSGSASVGSGNATAGGNQSSTNYSQGFGSTSTTQANGSSSSGSSGGGGSSNSSSTGATTSSSVSD